MAPTHTPVSVNGVPAETSVRAVERMPAQRKTMKLYPEAKHELVNELNRNEVIEDIVRFVEDVTA